MRLIFLRGTRNPLKGKWRISNAPQGEHIERGTILEIGTAPTLKELHRQDEKLGELVAALTLAHAVGDANDPAVVKRVEDEIAQDQRREAAAKAMDARAALIGTGERVVELAAQLNRVQPQPTPAMRGR